MSSGLPDAVAHHPSLSYYEENAASLVERTRDLNLGAVHEPFLRLLPSGARILDAGCGSGRDSRRFLEQGYKVTAFDASEALVSLASAHAGIPVLLLRFDEVGFEECFDGVWACASLLHVPGRGMNEALQRLSRSLKPGGVFYASFRYGEGETVAEDGRLFNNHTEHTFREVLRARPELGVVDLWRAEDTYRPDVAWLGVLLRKR